MALTCIQAQTLLPDTPRVTVSGMSSMEVDNDIATIVLTVSAQTVEKAKAEALVKENLGRLTTWLSSLNGVRNVETQTVRVQQLTDRRNASLPAIVGYEALVVVTAKVEAAHAGELLGDAVTNGATQVNDVSFGLSLEIAAKLEGDLLSAAFEAAKAKAEILATVADGTLGNAFDISTQQQFSQPMAKMAMSESMASDSAAATPYQLSEGKSNITSSVQVSFELRSTHSQQ